MRVILGLTCVGLVGLLATSGCSSDEDSSGTGGSSAAPGGCWPQDPSCYVDGPTGPGAECLAKKDNSGETKWQGRLTSIQVLKPAALAQKFIQTSIIDNGVSLNQKTCNESGEGTFTWLLELDSTTNKLKTGGGLPIKDPRAPACFVSLPTPLPVGPITVDVNVNGLEFSASGLDVNVPIFLNPDDTSNAIVLPLRSVDFVGSFNDDAHNCIGSYNGDELGLDNTCLPDTTLDPPQRAWKNGGTLNGYITIEQADQVYIDELSATLCAYLAGVSDWKGPAPDFSCATSAKWLAGERPPGDWCSTTDAPADASCSDAWQLEGAFAAAAFPISGDCP